MTRKGSSFLAIIVLCAVLVTLLFGSFLHASVEHEHHGKEAIWNTLHAAPRYEEKIVFENAPLFIFFVAVLVARVNLLVLIEAVERDMQPLSVRRGIIPHRKFL